MNNFNINKRPLLIDQLVGNIEVRTTLQTLIAKDKLRVVILSGQAGCGKSTLAKDIALTYQCKNPINGRPCLHCENCKKIQEKLFLKNESCCEINLIYMNEEGNKDKVLEIGEELRCKRNPRFNKRIYILEEPQNLHKSAMDTFLKIFEYVPEGTLFILCTTDLYKLNTAIKSRGTIFNIKPPKLKETTELLENICNSVGNINYSKTALQLISEHFRGVPRDCINCLENVMALGDVVLENVTKSLGLINIEIFIEFFECLEGDISEIILFIRSLSDRNINIAQFMIELKKFFYEAYITKYVADKRFTKSDMDRIRRLFNTYDYKQYNKVHLLLSNVKVSSDELLNESELLAFALSFKDVKEVKPICAVGDNLNSITSQKYTEKVQERLTQIDNVTSDVKDILDKLDDTYVVPKNKIQIRRE